MVHTFLLCVIMPHSSLTYARALLALTCHVAILFASSGELMAQQVRAQASPTRTLQSTVRLGTEHDDNALRTTVDPQQDWLTRYFASLDLALRNPGDRSIVALSMSQGGKLFLEQNSADMLLTQASLSWQKFLPTSSQLFTRLTLDFKDRTERRSLQDYYRAGGMWGVGGRPLPRLLLDARGGVRTFAFKPNPAASSRGFAANMSARLSLPAQLSLVTSYSWTQRRFALPMQERVFPESPDGTSIDGDQVYLEPGDRVRQDLFHAWTSSIAWQGPLLADLTYTWSLNRSNSYGQDLQRHNIGLSLTASLPWKFFCAGRIELQRTRYDDPILLDANFIIDEDNRNMGTLSLVRTIAGGWETELRSSIYLQEFGGVDDYSRRTIMLALGHQFDRNF